LKAEFTPPIKSRTTEKLLEIVGAPKKWNPDAVRLAHYELADRNVPSKKVERAKYLSEKKELLKKELMANEGYTVFDFIFSTKKDITYNTVFVGT
jgi:hypothetical protein